MSEAEGFTEDQLFDKFSEDARYVGGGCYRINYFGQEIFDSDTSDLFEKYKKCFVRRKDRYYYK